MTQLRRPLMAAHPISVDDLSRQRLIFLDFEASSLLLESFPIEIGWVDEAGRGECHLIRPHDEWLTGDCPGWSKESEAVHGISLDVLLRDGTSVPQVAARTAEVLSAPNVQVLTDGGSYDARWLECLLEFGGRREVVALTDVREAYGWACRPLLHLFVPRDRAEDPKGEERGRNLAQEIIARAEEPERNRQRVRHRALPDAEGLWRTWRSIIDEVARYLAENGGEVRPGSLFRAEYRGETSEIGRAEWSDVAALAGALAGEKVRDTLSAWTLVVLRWPGNHPPDIHALGWREAERNVWVTSPIVCIDMGARLVRTRSGHVYRLGAPDLPELAPSLRSHLLYALRTWGYTDVRR